MLINGENLGVKVQIPCVMSLNNIEASDTGSDIKLADVQKACSYFVDLTEQIKTLEDKLKGLKKDAQLLSEETIPSMLDEVGLLNITLATGQKISVKDDVQASIPKDENTKSQALSWMDNHGFGDLIKTKVIVAYDRENRAEALSTASDLFEKGLNVSLDENVHPMTLKSWIKEQLANGNDVPLELFGARQFRKTVIK